MSLLLVSGRYPPRSDGIGDYTAGLAQALRHAGWPVAVLTGDAETRRHGDAATSFPASPRRPFSASAPVEGGERGEIIRLPRWDAAGLRAAVDVLRQQRPTAVLWQYNPFSYGRKGLCLEYALLPWLVRRATDAPVVVTLHELAYPWGRGGWRGLVWAAVQRLQLAAVARTASALVVTTGARATWLRQYGPRARVARIPVGSSLPAVRLAEGAPQAVRARFGLPAYAYLLGAFGTLNDGRPLGGTLGALARVPDAWLVWVGDLGGAERARERRQRLADALGVGGRVRWLG
ncbi:MAG: glycosyltransferase, partial [Chloroflexi bacterium]|nr:glycosyltransferase [Chloroflexota bacterium]